ncbi:MAG: hypothetical protein ABSG42_01915 [Nitrospirota bacterium]
MKNPRELPQATPGASCEPCGLSAAPYMVRWKITFCRNCWNRLSPDIKRYGMIW